MSVVIVGGNECMSRRYRELCESYDCTAKVFPKLERNMKDLGQPDLVVLFTGTMSHKMLRLVMNEVRGKPVTLEHCRSASVSALREVLERRAGHV